MDGFDYTSCRGRHDEVMTSRPGHGHATGGGAIVYPSSLRRSEAAIHRQVENDRYRFGRALAAPEVESAAELVARRYAWRGYDTRCSVAAMSSASELPLIASRNGEVHGTLTVRLDDRASLLSEALYPDEIAALRAQGAMLCEFGKLAFRENVNTLEILGPLFHIGLLYLAGQHGCTDAVVEVNPRHVGFYRRLFGFTVIGEQRICPRVSAPAQLLRLSLQEAVERAQAEGGARSGHRSIYPYCLGRDEVDMLCRAPAGSVDAGLPVCRQGATSYARNDWQGALWPGSRPLSPDESFGEPGPGRRG